MKPWQLIVALAAAALAAGCTSSDRIWGGGGANYDYNKVVKVFPANPETGEPEHRLISCNISGLSNRDQVNGVGLSIDGDCNLNVGIDEMSAQRTALLMSILGKSISQLPPAALKALVSGPASE